MFNMKETDTQHTYNHNTPLHIHKTSKNSLLKGSKADTLDPPVAAATFSSAPCQRTAVLKTSVVKL